MSWFFWKIGGWLPHWPFSVTMVTLFIPPGPPLHPPTRDYTCTFVRSTYRLASNFCCTTIMFQSMLARCPQGQCLQDLGVQTVFLNYASPLTHRPRVTLSYRHPHTSASSILHTSRAWTFSSCVSSGKAAVSGWAHGGTGGGWTPSGEVVSDSFGNTAE